MTPSAIAARHAALQAAFDRIVDLGPPDRTAAVAELRLQDAMLADELEALLSADAQADVCFAALEHPEFGIEEPDPLIGATVSHYRIESRIGSGGMGVVYRAVDERLERPVALKFLWNHLSRDPLLAQRFLVEARAASALEHDHIGAVHELDWTDDGRAFFVMPCYEGASLAEMLKHGPLDIPRAVGIALQVADGLAAAHGARIIHRDVKPANIWIKPDGTVKLVDFGLAKVAGSASSGIGATPGTASYMSPEQTKGEKVSEQTDIWSLGATLYEMLTGKRAFLGKTTIQTLEAVLEREPEDVLHLRPEIPLSLAEVVWTSLQKDRNRRYKTMAEVVDALRLCMDEPSRSPLFPPDEGQEATHQLASIPSPDASSRGIPPVESSREAGSDSPSTLNRPAWAVALLIIVGASAGWWIWSVRGSSLVGGQTHTPTIAVLPLRSYGDSRDAWMAEEFAENLTTGLRDTERLRVVPYLTSRAHASRREPIRAIARSAGAEYVLDGTIRHAADSHWVSLDLWEARAEMHLRSFQFSQARAARLDAKGSMREEAVQLILLHIFPLDPSAKPGEHQ